MDIVINFFFNDTATTEIYTLSLHDALPISAPHPGVDAPEQQRDGARVQGEQPDVRPQSGDVAPAVVEGGEEAAGQRGEIGRAHVLNSSHANISYAVFCLKKKTKIFLHTF